MPPLLDEAIESVSKSMCMAVDIVERTEKKNSCGFTSHHHMLRVCVCVLGWCEHANLPGTRCRLMTTFTAVSKQWGIPFYSVAL